MSYQPKPKSGTLFKNEKKSDKHPDYRGKLIDENGKEWALAAWIKEGKNGKFLSLAYDEPRANPYKQPMNLTATDNGGELPF